MEIGVVDKSNLFFSFQNATPKKRLSIFRNKK